MLAHLSNDLLLESYQQALEHGLSADFISILETELIRRGMLNRCG
ncbi:sporulation histidine kinase inhibitor Sda [Shouchella patagoniensis]|nr:sporulation histidine kinase inhibitor Sda [Shouchella patagoniensis]